MTASTSLGELFSAAVSTEEVRAEVDLPADESLLWPEEEAVLGPVVAGRRRDFVRGRRCARLAMGRLGVEPAPVLRGPKREPLWPGDVVGAITHTSGFAAAAVALRGDAGSIGLDAEPDEPLPPGVLERVAREEDLVWVESWAGIGVANPDRLLFTLKEAVYKAWYPLARRWLGFNDAAIEIDSERRSFRASILIDGPLRTMTGRFAAVDGVIIAAVEVPNGTFLT